MNDMDISRIEQEINDYWNRQQIYRVKADTSKPKYYVLDMFPYPSGAGLHVGHPLGYIASDIISRYKRLKGYNVLHPMGYDAFGLPAEQYAIQTGQHPAITSRNNIERYREQLDKIGFSFDWSREVRTCEPEYYKWTQWIFIQLYNSWYNKDTNRAEPVSTLIKQFEEVGSQVHAYASPHEPFTPDAWKQMNEVSQQTILLHYRLAYLADSWVNWCPALGCVLANDEVRDGVSERGGYPVEQRLMKQWSLRITAYAERLLQGLNAIDWSESMKEAQRNWIGKSEGAYVRFSVADTTHQINVFTTRPDTIFGVAFMVLAPEHDLVERITTPEHKQAITEYQKKAAAKTERDRSTDVKNISGCFTGAYALHPFTQKQIPIYIADYVLATYGTGAVMAVPCGDSRDYRFAKHFTALNPFVNVFEGVDVSVEACESKDVVITNSDFLNGLKAPDAIQRCIEELTRMGIGERKTNYRLRDAVFGRQRYWGEPIPVYYKENIPYVLPEHELPLRLPEIDKYIPSETGEPPLARAKDWKYMGIYEYEKTTMPGWAGSSWYFFRYMDPNNPSAFASKEALHYWQDVDFYLGGSEHATGHLLYFRFWTKVLHDLGHVPCDEPARKLLNQGMIQGISSMAARIKGKQVFVSNDILNDYLTEQQLSHDDVQYVYADIHQVSNQKLDTEAFRTWNADYSTAQFVYNNKKEFTVKQFVEKMSKSKYNVVNPDDVVATYGADCFRMYEMFLGPIELSKPWDTQGIDGVSRFIRKLWRLFYNEQGQQLIHNDKAPAEGLKILHRAIKKVNEDLERLSFNTCVSTFMICVNDLSANKYHHAELLKPLLTLLHPFAPFISEYLWLQSGETTSILDSVYPVADESLLIENTFEYPVSVNGKMRTKALFPLDKDQKEIEAETIQLESVKKWMEGKPAKKIIFVKGRMINIVV